MNQGNTLPHWLKKNRDLASLHELKTRLRKSSLSTVCEEARCPNITECFSRPTATFLILGDTCTRNCRFCSITKGRPSGEDGNEPGAVAQAALDLGLDHVVITSVTRDDLPDQGAGAFAKTIIAVREKLPDATIEVLTPDFQGEKNLLKRVLDAGPDVFNHNVETSSRLYNEVRPGASFERSLEVLATARSMTEPTKTLVKSGFMTGLGEDEDEIADILRALAGNACDIVTIGQYMQPTVNQLKPQRYWEPGHFDRWADLAKFFGIRYVVSGPFVRSSYKAKQALDEVKKSLLKERL